MESVKSYAKINWTLRVTGRRPDGFHDLETLFQTISLHDTLTFRPSDRLAVTCDDPSIPTDESNLVVRAARLLGVDRVSIHIEKRIPAGGGLGGGSSNAAATLRTLSRMFELSMPLEPPAPALGSDVPFFLMGGTAYATGRGEVLTPFPDVNRLALLLVIPDQRVATADAFRRLRRFSKPMGQERHLEIASDLQRNSADLVNDFEEPVFESLPELRDIRDRLLEAGAVWARMSGSGSTIVGVFDHAQGRDAAAAAFSGLRVERASCVARGA